MIKAKFFSGGAAVIKERSQLYKKGDLINCPKCDALIAKLARNIYQDDMICENMFEFKQARQGVNQKTVCSKCETSWFSDGLFLKITRK